MVDSLCEYFYFEINYLFLTVKSNSKYTANNSKIRENKFYLFTGFHNLFTDLFIISLNNFLLFDYQFS